VTRFVLVHSPFLGPSSWRGVARALGRVGAHGETIDYEITDGDAPYEAVGEQVGSAIVATAGPSILVAHSGAGGLVPAIVHHTAASAIAGVILVDAVLPRLGRNWFHNTPSELADHLLTKVSDGRLPPWNAWYPRDPIAELVSDPEQRGEIVAELPRVPLAFLRAPTPSFTEWQTLAKGYLRLGKAYDGEAARAAEKGWPVERAALHHLAIITEPDRVAVMLIDLSARLK
jgi:hypothetical protein